MRKSNIAQKFLEVARLLRSWRVALQEGYMKLGKLHCGAPTERKFHDDVGFVYREIPQQLSSEQDLWHNLYLFMSSVAA